MARSRLLLVLAVIIGAATGTFGAGASAHASQLDGAGLHCQATELRPNLYTEGCAAVGVYPDFSYIFGETEASAYQILDGQRVPTQKVLVRIATSDIYVNGQLADSRPCSCAPATYVRDATRNVQPGQLATGNTAQAAMRYEVYAVRGAKQVLLETHTVMSEVVATPDLVVSS
jgi:hypothetical protein